MGKLLTAVLHFLVEKIRWLIVIVFVLLVGGWLRHEWQTLVQVEQDKQQLQTSQQQLQQRYQQLLASQQQLAKATQTLSQQLADKARKQLDVQKQLQQARMQRDLLWDEHWVARNNPLSEASSEIRFYELKIAALSAQLAVAQRAKQEWQNRLNQAPEFIKSRELLKQMEQSQSSLKQLEQDIGDKDRILGNSWLQQARTSIWSVLPAALTILLGVILAPVIFKILMYFGIAPLVSRLPAIRILPDDSRPVERPLAAQSEGGQVSSHSLALSLNPEQELLIHSDYLQSYSRQAQKSTRWFLNAGLPFTSLASGLVTLVRVQSQQPESVQIASLRHVHAELMVLDLPEGAALVCKPHCLVGAVKSKSGEITISSHWRFGLHSWLTLQFRYLVFHGACQLIIKGNRGVIVETVGTPRLIQQAATLGFSAGVSYSNFRCETFVSYYMGKDSLFNDQFDGKSGIYFYEQIPESRRQQDWLSRVLGGFWDAVLKIFGI